MLVSCVLGLGFAVMADVPEKPAQAWMAQELMLASWDNAGSAAERGRKETWTSAWPLARLSARDGNIRLVVLNGSVESGPAADAARELAHGPRHLAASAVPGERGNAVIFGRRDTHFRFLGSLVIGDRIEVESPAGRQVTFEVVGLDVVDARRGAIVLDTKDSYLTLVTGYPFSAATAAGPGAGGPAVPQRFVVTARKRSTAPPTQLREAPAALSASSLKRCNRSSSSCPTPRDVPNTVASAVTRRKPRKR